MPAKLTHYPKVYSVAANRNNNAMEIVQEAERMVDASGRPVQPVPGGVIFKWVECASLETDVEMRRRWAALLANAFVAYNDTDFLPGYIEILRQLTPLQARILQSCTNCARRSGVFLQRG